MRKQYHVTNVWYYVSIVDVRVDGCRYSGNRRSNPLGSKRCWWNIVTCRNGILHTPIFQSSATTQPAPGHEKASLSRKSRSWTGKYSSSNSRCWNFRLCSRGGRQHNSQFIKVSFFYPSSFRLVFFPYSSKGSKRFIFQGFKSHIHLTCFFFCQVSNNGRGRGTHKA